MAVLFPVVEVRAPGLLVTRYEWPHLLLPEVQGEVLRRCRAESSRAPVGLVFLLADRIHEVPQEVRPFWRRVVNHPELRIAAMAIVTGSWSVEVEAKAFAVTNAMHGTGLQVAVFGEASEAVAWADAARMAGPAGAIQASGPTPAVEPQPPPGATNAPRGRNRTSRR